MSIKHSYFECACSTPRHVLRVTHFPEDFDTDGYEFYVEIRMDTKLNFLGRLVNAFKYLFKLNPEFGEYDETILSKSEAERLAQHLSPDYASFAKTKALVVESIRKATQGYIGQENNPQVQQEIADKMQSALNSVKTDKGDGDAD